MEEWMERILQDLNRMSRVAVIEQAYDVESMLRNYAKILKYRWSYVDKEIPIQMECIHLDMLLAYYRIQFNKQLSFKLQLEPAIMEVKIPHYTLMGIVISILDAFAFTSDGMVNCTISSLLQKKEQVEQKQIFQIAIHFSSNMNLKQVVVRSQNKADSYESFEGACFRWKQIFTDAQIELRNDVEHAISINLYGSFDET